MHEEFSKFRLKIIKKLRANNICVRPTWKLLHTLKPYKKCQKMNLKNSLSMEKRIINIPSSVNTF